MTTTTPPRPAAAGASASANASPNANANPSIDPSLLVGKVVKIVNTIKYSEECGRCTAYNAERQRCTIQINPATVVSIRAESTIAATMVESLKFQALEMKQKAQMMAQDPALHRQVLQLYEEAKKVLPAGLAPERLVLGWLVLTTLSLWFLGVSKTFLLGSTLALPIAISLPDVVNNGVRDPKILLQNFPRNIKDSIVRTTGGKFGTANMDQRLALGGFMIIVAMTVKILITAAPTAAAGGSMAMDSSSGRELSSSATTVIETTLREMYQLGFQDGSSGGTSNSLTEQVLSQAALAITAAMPPPALSGDFSDDFDLNYMPPPPAPKQGLSQKLGFTTLMAGMNIFRTLSQLGHNPNGDGFDPSLMMANVKLLPPWQMGLLGLSVYRVVSIFL